ncbi:hypothetical protein E7Z54_06125 [Nocardioides sp.]|nr:hypothetical protein E7Z54_06125 [Nocardioides sp.]
MLASALGVAIAAAVATSAGAGAATAAGTGQDYGQHVRTCAQTMGFDGTHNPGMHTGFAGWDASHAC